MLKKLGIVVALSGLLFASCGETTSRPSLPNSIGHMGELAIVAGDEIHLSTIGQAIDSVFDMPQPYFFNVEGYFRIFDIRPPLFQSVAKSYHTIVILKVQGDDFATSKYLPAPYSILSDSLEKINDTAKIRTYLKKNLWAFPQQVLFIYAKTKNDLYDYLLQNREKLVERVVTMERESFTVTNKTQRQDTIAKFLAQNFGFSLDVPDKFRIAKLEQNGNNKFAWIRRETPHISQDIVVYTQPYTNKQQLVIEDIILSRDSVLGKYIPGEAKGSYMATEKAFPFMHTEMEFKGHYTVEVRALWKTENDFMGGPFYSLTMVDEAHGQLVTVEGFVYSPKYDKTQYLRNLEVILNSIKWE
jgi:hypothetical protein